MSRQASSYPVMARLSASAQRFFAVDERKPALFLDRDGIVNIDSHYVGRVEEVVVFAQTAQAIREANGLSIPVVVVSNQSGVGRGWFGWDAVTAVDDRIAAILAESGAAADLVVYAGAHPADGDDPFRKPNPGMFQLAARMLGLDLERSWMVGDKIGDLEAAARAGLRCGALVEGPASELGGLGERFPAFRALAFGGLTAAFAHVLGELKRGSEGRSA